MSNSSSSVRKFKLDKMAELKRVRKQEVATEESPARGRCSFFSIPPPKLDKIYQQIATTQKKSKEEVAKEKEETLADELCNAYRFVVNYGVFEANFEWLPNEVREIESARLELAIEFKFRFFSSYYLIASMCTAACNFVYTFSIFSFSFTFFNS